MIKKILVTITYILAIVMIIDFLGFIAWVASGQTPVDGFYVGRLTTELLKLILL